jgi:hypothetical protein
MLVDATDYSTIHEKKSNRHAEHTDVLPTPRRALAVDGQTVSDSATVSYEV